VSEGVYGTNRSGLTVSYDQKTRARERGVQRVFMTLQFNPKMTR